MKKRTYRKPDSDIKELNGQLRKARCAIIDIAPEFYRELLEDYSECISRPEVMDWLDRVVRVVLEHADVFDKQFPDDPAPRTYAYCPLCRHGVTSFTRRRGFVFPDGLKRHLDGSHGADQCLVLEQVVLLARSYVDERRGRYMF